MNYEEALVAVSALAPRGWRLGLDRMFRFLELAQIEPSVKFIHITGTNGKGSVTATVQSILIEQGHRAGAFFSPFVHDPMERIQIGRRYLGRDSFARLATRLLTIGEESGEEITEFEMKTAIGLAAWEEAGCDWVALEVGLGGRFDATNVINGEVSVITSIGLDHTAILGNTLEEIAFEKSGIIKPGKPVVIGAIPAEARAIIENVASQLNAPLWRLGQEVTWTVQEEGYRVRTPQAEFLAGWPKLAGPHQVGNMAVAIAACDAAGAIVSPECVSKGVESVRLPGRMERRKVGTTTFILDGAHNQDAAAMLALTLSNSADKIPVVAGMLAGHDPVAFFEPLKALISELHLVPIDFHRAVPPHVLAEQITELGLPVMVHQSVDSGLLIAQRSGSDVLVTGSFYLVGEAGNQLTHLESRNQ